MDVRHAKLPGKTFESLVEIRVQGLAVRLGRLNGI